MAGVSWVWVVIATSAVLGVASLGCAVALLRCRSFLSHGVPTFVTTIVSGTLSGLALLVMLPSALEEARLHGETTASVMLTFAGAPLGMFFIHHILFEHHHHPPQSADLDSQPNSSSSGGTDSTAAGGGSSIGSPKGTAPVWWKQRTPGCAHDRCRQGCSGPGSPRRPASPKPLAADGGNVLLAICDEACGSAVESRRASADDQEPPTPEELVLVFVRAAAWFVHSVLDGAMLGAAQSVPILFATLIPVVVCALQDVGSLVVSDAARRQTNGQTVLTSFVFAAGFPVGTALVACIPSWAETELALPLLRAAVAGIFFYMAIFELGPPHAHGRWASLMQLAAFMLGLSAAYVAELTEDAIIASANGHMPDASVATRLRGTHIDPREHVAAAVVAAASRAGGQAHEGWRASTAGAAVHQPVGGHALIGSSM